MRKFATLGILVLLSLLLVSCGTPAVTPSPEVEQEPTAEVPTAAPESRFQEAPMLADKVAAGDLPPVDERLPENPQVIKSLTGEQGVYGGEMKIGFTGTDPHWGGMMFVGGWDGLLQWKPDFSGYEYSLAESIDVSDDVTEYTIHLRKGLKWSDGDPYNADDIMFYIKDVLQNEDISPEGAIADWLPSDMKDDFKAEKIDETTVKLIFPKPYGAFLYSLTGWPGRYFTMYPQHYLSQFHKAYNPDVDELVKADEEVTDWVALFYKKGPDTWANPVRWYDNTEMPSMYPWITTQPIGTGTQIRMERNPYYWKVDEQGNQLPYIDTLLGISYQDNESRVLAMLNGDVDYIKDPGNENRVLFHDAMDEGKPIQMRYPMSDGANTGSIHFNMSYDDAVKAEVYSDINFRIGMSYAINRPQIIEIVFAGEGEPAQVAPNNDSPFYLEGMDTQYVEYNVAKANEYLDKVLPEKDANGMRLDKNGKPFSIVLAVKNDTSFGTQYVQICELLIGYWKAVGIEVQLNSMPGDQYDLAQRKNQIEAALWTGEGGAGVTPILDPRYYVALWGGMVFDQSWYVWRVPDPTGESVSAEPPQWAKDAYAKWEDVLAQPTFEKQVEKMLVVLEEAKERFYVIGISRPASMYYPFATRLGGIPETWYDGWNEGATKIQYPEQWFINE